MSTTIALKFSTFTSNLSNILKDIDFAELDRRKRAAKFAAKVMRDNISEKGVSTPGGFPSRRTGAARKKVAYRLNKEDRSADVGTKDFKAHLLEFGHGDGKTRNKRPFVFRSLKQAEPEVIKIMSERYFD